ncbi:MAG: HIT domain-containing protein [Nanoarchaeota archaeon]
MSAQDLQNMSSNEILELQKKNCIFCKIISKEIPSNEVYSDDKVFVILDINPAGEGHCLILPKDHYQILPQIPNELVGYLFKVAKKISRSLLKALGNKGTTVFVANGALAGQKAPHFMIHVLPRRQGDLLFQIPKNNLDEKELDALELKLSMMPKQSAPKPEKQVKESEKIIKKEEKNDKKQERDKPLDIDIDDIANMFLGGEK